jgi:hypothetical protein
MRRSLITLLFVLFAVQAGAVTVIGDFQPREGFTFGPSHVTILGSGFTDGAVEVFFGGVKGTVLEATPTMLRVLTNPVGVALDKNGEALTNLSVRVAGQPEAFAQSFFYFSPYAQPGPEDYTPVIVPLTAGQLSGANGSIWDSELYIFNASTSLLRMPGPETFIVELPIDPAVIIAPRTTDHVFMGRLINGMDGAFLFVPNPLKDAAKMSLRVRDLSKNAASLGTEVPVPSIDDGAGDITLIDIPVDPKYRARLRIYAFTEAPMNVGVKVFPASGDHAIESYNVELDGIIHIQPVELPPYPAYAAIDPLTPAVRGSGEERVRIEITNYNAIVSPPPPKIWAFISITNNDTQQVTTVTPR